MDEIFVKAQEYISNHYMEPDMSLTELCGYLGFSSSYFSTLFKAKMGKNYSRYLMELRLHRAAELLRDTDDTALSIGYQVGYSAPNYFSREFKRRFGMSPSAYRKEQRKGLPGVLVLN